MSTIEAITQIFNKLTGTTKWQLDFYGNFQKIFDWLDFNLKVSKTLFPSVKCGLK